MTCSIQPTLDLRSSHPSVNDMGNIMTDDNGIFVNDSDSVLSIDEVSTVKHLINSSNSALNDSPQMQAFRQQLRQHELTHCAVHLSNSSASVDELRLVNGTRRHHQPQKVEAALSYLDKVKARFSTQQNIYIQFLNALNQFKAKSIETQELLKLVGFLFHDHVDLILEFNALVPSHCSIQVDAIKQTISLHQPHHQPVGGFFRLNSLQAAILLNSSSLKEDDQVKYVSEVPHLTNEPFSGGELFYAHPPSSLKQYDISSLIPQRAFNFQHTMTYINKIKSRFQGRPQMYNNFVDIVLNYGNAVNSLTEAEILEKVERLFVEEIDLCDEFRAFFTSLTGRNLIDAKPICKKRPHLPTVDVDEKKQRFASVKDVSLADSCKYATLKDFSVFDKIRKVLKFEDVYKNFLRCVHLFNCEILTRDDLMKSISPFLFRFPQLMTSFKETLGHSDRAYYEAVSSKVIGPRSKEKEEDTEAELEVDFITCKKKCASYRKLPSHYVPARCSGRTALCDEVLNDSFVSFPYSSEDSHNISLKKNQYEELMYRIEDERYELDMVLDMNAMMVRALESVNKKLQRMTQDEAAKFRLSEDLGASSALLACKAIQRIYGEKARDIIQGLMRNPAVAVPLVLRRLKTKDSEWREAQRGFIRIWREHNEKYHLKALDHQNSAFKQSDTRNIRRNAILHNIESLADERLESGGVIGSSAMGCHVKLSFPARNFGRVLADASGLLIYFIRRQASINREDKLRVKRLLCQTLHDFFCVETASLSGDEDAAPNNVSESSQPTSNGIKKKCKKKSQEEVSQSASSTCGNGNLVEEELYSLFFADKNWYIFLRLFHMLCERLSAVQGICACADVAAAQRKPPLLASITRKDNAAPVEGSAAVDLLPYEYYGHVLDLLRKWLDGCLDTSNFEDQMRELLGVEVYPIFTLDKIVNNAARHLQFLVTEYGSVKMTRLWAMERNRTPFSGAGGSCGTRVFRVTTEEAYRRRAEKALVDEHCFRLVFFTGSCCLTVELLDSGTNGGQTELNAIREVSSWQSYVDQFTTSTDDSPCQRRLERPLFLFRNFVRWHAFAESLRKCEVASNSSTCKMECVETADDDMLVSSSVELKESVSFDLPQVSNPSQSQSSAYRDIVAQGWHGNTSNASLFHDVLHWDRLELFFKENCLKMSFKAGSESYFYRSRSLTRARNTRQRLVKERWMRWSDWHVTWLRCHVSGPQKSACSAWLIGSDDAADLRAHSSKILMNQECQVHPYRPYFKYLVAQLKDTCASSQVVAKIELLDE